MFAQSNALGMHIHLSDLWLHLINLKIGTHTNINPPDISKTKTFQGSVCDGLGYVIIIILFSVLYNAIKFFEFTTSYARYLISTPPSQTMSIYNHQCQADPNSQVRSTLLWWGMRRNMGRSIWGSHKLKLSSECVNVVPPFRNICRCCIWCKIFAELGGDGHQPVTVT